MCKLMYSLLIYLLSTYLFINLFIELLVNYFDLSLFLMHSAVVWSIGNIKP